MIRLIPDKIKFKIQKHEREERGVFYIDKRGMISQDVPWIFMQLISVKIYKAKLLKIQKEIDKFTIYRLRKQYLDNIIKI